MGAAPHGQHPNGSGLPSTNSRDGAQMGRHPLSTQGATAKPSSVSLCRSRAMPAPAQPQRCASTLVSVGPTQTPRRPTGGRAAAWGEGVSRGAAAPSLHSNPPPITPCSVSFPPPPQNPTAASHRAAPAPCFGGAQPAAAPRRCRSPPPHTYTHPPSWQHQPGRWQRLAAAPPHLRLRTAAHGALPGTGCCVPGCTPYNTPCNTPYSTPQRHPLLLQRGSGRLRAQQHGDTPKNPEHGELHHPCAAGAMPEMVTPRIPTPAAPGPAPSEAASGLYNSFPPMAAGR